MAAPDDDFFASLEKNFIGIGCTMEAQTTLSDSTQYGLFIGDYKKYKLYGVTFSFNILVLTCKSLIVTDVLCFIDEGHTIPH